MNICDRDTQKNMIICHEARMYFIPNMIKPTAEIHIANVYCVNNKFIFKWKKKKYFIEDAVFRRGEMLLSLSHFLSADYKGGSRQFYSDADSPPCLVREIMVG